MRYEIQRYVRRRDKSICSCPCKDSDGRNGYAGYRGTFAHTLFFARRYRPYLNGQKKRRADKSARCVKMTIITVKKFIFYYELLRFCFYSGFLLFLTIFYNLQAIRKASCPFSRREYSFCSRRLRKGNPA